VENEHGSSRKTVRTMRSVPASARVAIVLIVVSLVAFLVTRHLTAQDENSLLQSDAGQVAALTSLNLSGAVSLLDPLAADVTATDGSPSAFLADAQPLVHPPLSAALAKAYLTHFVVFAAVGPATRTGHVLGDAIVIATHREASAPSPGPVVSLPGNGIAYFAVGAPLVPDGNLVYIQVSLSPLMTKVMMGPAFADLRVALYGSPHPTEASLLALSSGGLLPHGAVASVPVLVDGVSWTLIAQARSPLIGGLATSAPVIILVLGLSLAVALGFALELLARRRAPLPAGRDLETGRIVSSLTTAPDSEGVTPVIGDPDEETMTETSPSVAPPDIGTGSTQDEDEAVRPVVHGSSQHADWRPDPFGRFELRRFFLDKPTSVVRNGAIESYDPISPSTEPDVGGPPSSGSIGPHSDDQLDGPAADKEEAIEQLAARVAQSIAEEIGDLGAPVSKVVDQPAVSGPEPSTPLAPTTTPAARPEPLAPPVPPAREHERSRSIAMASGAVGVVSWLWRRRRKRRRNV
jgi:hypothetical protein